ncbi:unnamed protein product [Paramecium octaurelia]|uniref:Uncharacterized protein n=1 Tax=Paramecium octaurelia TaxID=43137 RepID=A0A8S1WEB7_PAROT|nr:unnamed protein product [Paramecium octaurelia]
MSTSPTGVHRHDNSPYVTKKQQPQYPIPQQYQQSTQQLNQPDYYYDERYREFEEREEQYNYQIQKMNDYIQQLQHDLDVSEHAKQGFESDYQKAAYELQLYKDQLKKLYTIYQQQTAQFETIKKKTQESNLNAEKTYEKQFEIKNDVQNLILDRDLLLNKLELGDKQYNFDVQSLTQQLNDKNAEIQDQRRRINELTESKRKADEEIASLRFTLDHQTARLEAELREKVLKLEALDKQFAEALYLKDNELVDAFDKIRILEHEVRRILDLNRSYAQELSMLARDNRFKQEEIAKVREDAKPAMPQQITVQSGGMEPRMPPAWAEKFHIKIDACLDLFERNHAKSLKQLCLNLWKTKMELKARNKQNKAMVEENSNLGKSVVVGGGTDMRVTTYFIDSFVAAITFARDAISNVVFDVFVKSVNKANNKKLNSFVLFFESLKEMQQKSSKGLWLALETYAKLRKALRHSVPILIDAKVQSGLLQKVELAMGKLLKHDMDFRNNINKWLEGTLAFTVQKKEAEAYDKNKDYLFLFRLLTVKYRIKFPLQGKTFEVDVDIETTLEHKICYALRKVVKQQ